MEPKLQHQIAFYLTGRGGEPDLLPLDGGLRPALFARFRDLTALRYDFPLVLNRIGTAERSILSLSRLVDEAVGEMAASPERDRVARHGYRLERELRNDLAAGRGGEFADLWKAAAGRVAAADGDGESVEDSARRLWNEFQAGGEMVDVDTALPTMAVRHAWSAVQRARSAAFRKKAERLLQKLRDILAAEIAGSTVGRTPERLRAGVGSSFAGRFDFDAMSQLLAESKPGAGLSDKRRDRIRDLIAVFEKQRFYNIGTSAGEAYDFEFASCSEALAAYQERRAEAVELIRTLAVAELEVKGEYRETVHDRIFSGFGEGGLDARELAQLPDYLISTNASSLLPGETAQLVELLAAGLPVKVLVRTDDVLEPARVAEGHVALSLRARQLADTAIGLTDVFVFQAAASQLFRMRDPLLRGLEFGGPALFSIFSGDNEHTVEIPAYLVAAAAAESRVFPSFVYDPSTGSDWAARMSIADNPQPDEDWPVHEFVCEDEALQVVSGNISFTLADFMAMDERFLRNYAIVPSDKWHDGLVPVTEVVDDKTAALPDRLPYISLVDSEGRVQRAIADERTLSAVRRCRTMWNGLQELAGCGRFRKEVRNETAVAGQPDVESAAPAVSPDTPVSGPQIEPELPTEASLNGDDPYIETERCTTCNECTQINGKMFAYNENKQAFIADPDAGTFRQMVEAAESCQVSIIHPGKPRNPKEPGIEDLVRRAADFN